jgi:hypothetical protein
MRLDMQDDAQKNTEAMMAIDQTLHGPAQKNTVIGHEKTTHKNSTDSV